MPIDEQQNLSSVAGASSTSSSIGLGQITVSLDSNALNAANQQQSQDDFELESQFILRLPTLPAASLRAAIRSGVLNLKDRLTIQIDQDMRNGMVRFDGWVLPAKIVDLPTILESHKTLDNKNFYKTADINQIMICKEETDETKDENEESVKKTKDGRDKKYLYPHGITKPLKNVRKRRFRKTLKKKWVDFPEIEKEVKRLLRQDNEAVTVRYEIEDETINKAANDLAENKGEINDENDQLAHLNSNSALPNVGDRNVQNNYDVGDLFGDVVSSSDDEETNVLANSTTAPFSDEGSRMSSGQFRDYLKDQIDGQEVQSNQFTFTNAFQSQTSDSVSDINDFQENQEASFGLSQQQQNENESAALRMKIQELESEIQNLQTQRLTQQIELDNIENLALKQRFQAIIEDLKNQESIKKEELDELKKKL